MSSQKQQDYENKLDDIAENYHNADVPDKFIEEICQEHSLGWLLEKVSGKRNVLEMGYGDGVITKALLQKHIPFEVIEGSPRVIAKARQSHPDLPISQTLFETFNPTRRYDCVLALHVLEHVDSPIDLLTRMRSWLDESGTIIIIVPNKNSLHRQLAVSMGLQHQLDDLSPRDHAVGHQRVYSLQTLREDVEQAGYSVIEETGFFIKTLPNSMMLDFSQELIQAMNDISPGLPPDLLANIGMVIQ